MNKVKSTVRGYCLSSESDLSFLFDLLFRPPGPSGELSCFVSFAKSIVTYHTYFQDLSTTFLIISYE